MFLRTLAVLVGLGLLSAAAHVTVLATGGYQNPHAILVLAVACGVAIGALCIVKAWRDQRFVVAALIGLALLSGEAFGLLQTGERLIANRETAQTPVRQIHDAKIDAQKHVAAIEAELLAFTTTARLDSALASKATADRAVIEQASLRGCASNCRKLLTRQVKAAAAEVAAARAELRTERDHLENRLGAAKAALAAIKLPPSTTGLADRIGWAPWALDLIYAALGSIGANGLGCALLAFGAHGSRRRATIEVVSPPSKQANPGQLEHAAHYGVERLTQTAGEYTTLDAIHTDYRAWCKQNGERRLPAKQIGAAVAELFENAGINVGEIEGRLVALNVTIKPPLVALADLRT